MESSQESLIGSTSEIAWPATSMIGSRSSDIKIRRNRARSPWQIPNGSNSGVFTVRTQLRSAIPKSILRDLAASVHGVEITDSTPPKSEAYSPSSKSGQLQDSVRVAHGMQSPTSSPSRTAPAAAVDFLKEIHHNGNHQIQRPT
ncbi:hypothetical protein ACLOJK_019377 [Asimina triloba]